ncbi:MAG TPA: response regulator [Candidatus Dormibacteraeota bacterium]|nr:response regulator [Candidatus Dormibacteraeota bacterium]
MEETKTNGAEAGQARLEPELLVDFGHQLRNQLNAIVGAAGLLSATATSSDQRELASVILTGAEELAGLVDEVLDSPVIHSGDFELALHPFNVRASVEACLARVATSAVSRGVNLSFSAGADVPKVIVGDSRRLEQILHSLLRMAAERTQQGAIHIELSCEPNQGPLKLRFIVRDSGEAVPQRVLDAAWTDGSVAGELAPGERLAALSLHTTRHLVEMMDGDLSIRRGGDGTAMNEVDFTFLAEASDAETDQHASLAGMQVLVVAADATERRVLAMQAELWGAPSTAAEPAEAARLVGAGQAFDLALIEHRKPVIDGVAVATELRSQRGRHELPIVLIVAGTLGTDEVMAADSGVVQATLAKPVPPQKLRDVMAQVGVRRAAPAVAPPVEEVGTVSLKVLVADDNTLNQNMLRRQISKLGHTVDVVSNGREAVNAVEQQPYDALLMDVLMPGMDGLQAAEEICRRWSRGTRPRLIALTAMAGPGDEERCRKAGFDDYMSKPVHMDELAEALKAAAGFRAAPKPLG